MSRVILILATVFTLIFFGFLVHNDKKKEESEESDEVG